MRDKNKGDINDSSEASPVGGGLEGARSADLNSDIGEGLSSDSSLMPFITSANIACGYHAGDEKTIWDTIQLSKQHKVAIGAHVSFLDKNNFGRSEMNLPGAEVYELITQQLIIIQEIADSFEMKLHHVKPHGALYNMSARDASLAKIIAEAVKDFDAKLVLYGLSKSHSIKEAAKQGLRTGNEVFADRTYLDDGSLMPRSQAGSIIEDSEKVVQQVLQMIQKKTVTSFSGKEIPINAETICIHGDHKNAVDLARTIYQTLKQNQVDIKTL